MIVDSSAIVAILRRQSKGAECLDIIERASNLSFSAASLLEASIVLDNGDDAVSSQDLDHFLEEYRIAIEPVTESQAKVARIAHRRFGRGRHHPARLNFGDCFAYALARDKNEPLLFVGDDFIHTDIRSALDPG